MPLFPHKHTRVYRSRGNSLSTPSLVLACVVGLPQLAPAQYRVRAIADGDSAWTQPVPSGIVLVIGEGVAVQDEGEPGPLALARLAATGARFSDVVSSSPCAVESLRTLATSRWARERDEISGDTRLTDIFASAGWAVAELAGGDPEAVASALADRVDTRGNAPFFVHVKVSAADSGWHQTGGVDSYLERVERVLAQVALAEGRYAEALELGRRVLRDDDQEAAAHMVVAEAFLQTGELQAAARHADQAAGSHHQQLVPAGAALDGLVFVLSAELDERVV